MEYQCRYRTRGRHVFSKVVGNVLVSGKLTPLQARRGTGVAENNLDASQINEINLNIIRGKYMPGRLKGKARPLCGNRNI